MIRKLRQWLNVKTWDQTHVPLEPELLESEPTLSQAEKVFPLHTPNVDAEVLELYLGLDAAIEKGEIDGIEAMTLFTQFGFAGDVEQGLRILRDYQPRWYDTPLIKTSGPWPMLPMTDEDVWTVKQVKKKLEQESTTPTISKTPAINDHPNDRAYVFPADLEKIDGHKIPVHVVPRSALLMPQKLTQEEREVAELAEKLKKFFDSGDVKLKPTTAKKISASNKRPHRVYWDGKGKMKEVKEPTSK